MKQQIPKVVVLRDFIIFLPFLLLTLSLVFFLPSDDNNKGVKFFSNKDFPSAVESFSQSIDTDYSNQRAYLNLALSQDRNNSPMRALNIYSFITKNFKSTAKFYSHFNQGELNGRLGKINEALTNYQAALEFQTKKREIKENIEWLFLNKQNQKSKKNQKKDSQAQNQQEEKSSSSEEKSNASSQQKDSQAQNQQEEKSSSPQQEIDNQKSEEKTQMKAFNAIETKSILDAIENQEADIRARQFKNKSRRQAVPGKKDW